MARYLLAANPMKFVEEDGTKYDGTCVFHGAWIEGHGLLASGFIKDLYSGSLGWMQLDGTFCPIRRSNDATGHEFHPGISALYPRLTHRMIGTNAFWNGETSSYDSWWLAASADDSYSNEMTRSVGEAGPKTFLVRDVPAGSDCWVLVLRQVNYSGTYYWDLYGGSDRYSYRLLAAKLKQQDPIEANPYGRFPDYRSFPVISPGSGNQYYICFPDGSFVLYDHSTESVVLANKYLEDASGYLKYNAQYVREHNIFIAYAWDGTQDENGNYPVQLRIFANEGVATTISHITADKALSSLAKITFSVTVTGEQGDGIEDCIINWSLNGGPGTLLSNQSVTGSDGVAQITYICPRTVPDSVTVTAEAII